MLKKQPWMKYENDLYIEWQQTKDEGREVGPFETICREISDRPSPGYAKLAAEIRQLMTRAPVSREYPYIEPSDLAGIRAARPKKRHRFSRPTNGDFLADKIAGGWLGRISGCLLGKPVEGFLSGRLRNLLIGTDNFPMAHFIRAKDFSSELIQKLDLDRNACWADRIGGVEPVDDDTNYTIFTLKLLETYGLDFTPDDVLEGWLSWIPMLATCTAERAAYRNAACGLLPPQTAIWKNPYREWIGAQIRGDLFGYVSPGDPERAAELAWRDASVSHIKNGIYGEMFVAAMIAAAAVCDDIPTIVEVGLDEIPEKSRLRAAVDQVLAWHRENVPAEEAVDRIHRLYDEKTQHGWCHTVPNAMIVTIALLYGNGEYGKTVCRAVQSAFDTDCNGATSGSVIGVLRGAKALPEEWIAPHRGRLMSNIQGYMKTSVPELTKKTLALTLKAK